MELIRRHPELGRLTKALSRQQRWKTLKHVLKTKTTEHYLLMCAPATAALAILKSGIHEGTRGEPGKGVIRMLIINAQTIDWIDEAQWYRYIPSMLSWDGELRVTVQTNDRSKHRSSRVVPVLKHKDRIAVDVIEGSLETALKAVSPDEFDIAIWFCPDYSKDAATTGWSDGRPRELAIEGIGTLLQRSVPVYTTAFSDTQAALNSAIAEAYGFGLHTVLEANPMGLVSNRSGENWSRAIQEFDSSFEIVESVDVIDEALLTIASQMALHSHMSGFAEQPYKIGQFCHIEEFNLVHSMDGICVDLEDGSIWSLRSAGLKRTGTLPDKERVRIGGFDPLWSETEKMLWAACVKNAAIGSDLIRAA